MLAILLLGHTFALDWKGVAQTSPWDRERAHRSLEEARAQREKLHVDANATREIYLLAVRTFGLVYRYDPHCPCSDDALMEQGTLCEEAARRFGRVEDYREAERVYRFLISDYPTSPFVPDALLALGDLLTGPLKQAKEGQAAYQELRDRFGSSRAARLLKENIPQKKPAPAAGQEPPSEPSALPAATVENIRHWSTNNYTRVTIDLDREARFHRTRLSDPDRIYFDISNARVNRELLNRTFVVGDQFLKQVRVGQNRVDTVRVVLDFAAIREFSVFVLHDPYRIVVDIHGSRAAAAQSDREGKEAAPTRPGGPDRKEPPAAGERPSGRTEPKKTLAARELPSASEPKTEAAAESAVSPAKSAAGAPATPPASTPRLPKAAPPTSSGGRTLTRALGLKIGRIVIDPGHGGHDTGTVGKNGLAEKDLVLEISRQLRDMLEQNLGAEVVMTREDDTFVALEERTAIANQARADLFISIHANAGGTRTTSGPETYYLNFARTEADRAVAARENATTVRSIGDLQSLISKIAQADKSAESRELAAMVQKRLFAGTRRLFPNARNRGVRTAPFVVLIGANMPSVLAEVAFISNPRDEKALLEAENQQRLATALFAGIEGYIKTIGLSAAQNRSSSP